MKVVIVMKKKILIIIIIIVGIIILDTIQAKTFDNKPVIKVVEDFNDGHVYQKHKGIFVSTYVYTDGSQKAYFNWTPKLC